MCRRKESLFQLFTVGISTVKKAICRMVNKAGRPSNDDVTALLLEVEIPALAPTLMFMINDSLTSGQVRSRWKEAIIVSARKSGDLTDPKNYRHI